MPYTPIQVARRANVAVQSIRNWSNDYAEFLSPAARGEAGPRIYSDEDMSVLCAVAALRKSGVRRDEIMQRLREEVPGVVDVVLESTVGPAVEDATLQATQSLQTEPQTALALYSLQSRVEALERHAERQVDRLVTGIILGAALTLLIVALALRMV